MKVTFVHPDLGIGGAERLVLDVAVALEKNGHSCTFYTNHCNKEHSFEEIKSGRFPVTVIGDWLPRHVFGKFQALCAYIRMLYLALMYWLCRVGDKEGCDLFFVDQIPVAVPILKWTGRKVVYYCHHPDLLASKVEGSLKKVYRLPIDWVEERCTGKADVLLVNSKYTADVFKRTFPTVKKKIEILYPTIAESFRNEIMQIKNPKKIQDLVPEIQKSNSVVFLSINRFHPAKNLELAINAFYILKNQKPSNNFHLILAGGYDPQSAQNQSYFHHLTTLTNIKGLSDDITFIRSPSDSLKAELLLSCDCLIYTPMREHFGIVPLEGMMAGKPVIACDSGGPRETVEHGVNGFLCDGTAESLAKFMEKMKDRELKTRMGKEGRKRLEAEFGVEKFVEHVGCVVERTVGNGKKL